MRFKLKLKRNGPLQYSKATNSRTVVLPPSIVYNHSVFYAILASDPLCRITVTVNSPPFSRLDAHNEQLQPLKKQPRAGKAGRSGTQDDIVYAHIFEAILESVWRPALS